MKTLYLLLLIPILKVGCVSTAPQNQGASSNNSVAVNSVEAQAKALTERMKTSLGLDQNQEEKVFMINLVHLKILKRLREASETDKISTTELKYREEMKAILTEAQYQKFLAEFTN
jgi:hypothetical protein